MPTSPEIFPFVPSSDTGHLDLLSDQSSPTKEEVRKIELQIFARDDIKLMKTASSSRLVLVIVVFQDID